MSNNIYPDLTNSKFDMKYTQAKILPSDLKGPSQGSSPVSGRPNIGSGIQQDTTNDPYVLPIATDTELGGIIIGNGLEVDDTGITSVEVSQESNNSVQLKPDGLYVPSTIRQGRIYGGYVTWVSNYTFEVSAVGFYLNNILYEFSAYTVALGNAITLDAPDATYNRIDVIYVDNTGVHVLKGVPSSTPEKPSITSNQIELSFVLVETGTTQPSINQVQMYKDNAGEPAEWTASSNSVNINVDSTSTPVEGTKSIEATNSVSGDAVTLTNDSPLIITGLNSILTFKIKPKALVGKSKDKNLRLMFKLSATLIGNSVDLKNGTYGLDNTSQVEQTISIPLADFGLANTDNVDNFQVLNISVGTYGFYLDDVKLQGMPLTPLITGATLPVGGLLGQVLKKKSDADFDADWEDEQIAWGNIIGDIDNQTDLISGGKILASLLPAIAITDTFVESSEAAMLSLTAETGDICVRTDETKTYILKGTDPSVLADWELLLTPTGGVVSVFGRSGAVTAQSGDYSFSLISGTASPTQGGTGLTTYAKGDVLIATGTNTVGVVSASATDGYVFTWDAASGLPMWKAASGGSSLPSMTGNANKWLTTDGTSASWQFNTGWSTTGNAGTDGGTTNFIGTTDARNLVVKTNNIKAFTVNTSQAIIMGDGNTPSKEYIYFRNIGSVGSSVGIGLTSGYGMGFFTGTNNAVFRWISGGISGTDLMSLGSGGLTVAGNIVLSGTISGVTSLTISGTLAAQLFKSDGSFNVPKIYYRWLGAATNTGVGYQLVSGVGSVQYFARSADTGWSWTYGGDLQTNSANVQMNLTTLGLSVLMGITAGTISNINSSAIIEGRSTTQGFLEPRMTTTQKNAITSVAEALQVYDNTLHCWAGHNGTAWQNFLYAADGTTKVTSGAPFTNDGYVSVNIGGTVYKLMTTT